MRYGICTCLCLFLVGCSAARPAVRVERERSQPDHLADVMESIEAEQKQKNQKQRVQNVAWFIPAAIGTAFLYPVAVVSYFTTGEML